ncbi:hypothetical protein HPB49_012766 [Dermacentor silvarum]|uniref:Uncharacterized protein n=1 Tax=Dermacentor silvarum TaxID=543639 RepID=A0ACB8D521_DERSI|nr:hypothetical protein HPB49_012766 [Dermacentor silvarum]
MPHTQLIDGIPRDPKYDAELFRSSLDFRARSQDLVLFTYPKSGTNWLMCIIQCILNGGEGVRMSEELTDNMRFLGSMDFEEWQPGLPLCLLVTHLSPRRNTMNKQAKYVYLARNPYEGTARRPPSGSPLTVTRQNAFPVKGPVAMDIPRLFQLVPPLRPPKGG